MVWLHLPIRDVRRAEREAEEDRAAHRIARLAAAHEYLAREASTPIQLTLFCSERDMTIKGFTGLGQTHIKGRKDFAARMDRLIAEARTEQERARAAQAQPGDGDSLKKSHLVQLTANSLADNVFLVGLAFPQTFQGPGKCESDQQFTRNSRVL